MTEETTAPSESAEEASPQPGISEPNSASGPSIAPLWRRLMAMLYDILLVVAVMMFYGAAFIGLKHALGIPMPEGERAASGPVFFGGMIITIGLFFCGFWVTKGQTLGMRTWRLRVEDQAGRNITWPTAILRIIAAAMSMGLLGLGYLWSLIDKQKQCWHDHLSHSRIVVVPRTKK
ncbi:MAG: RDD family protein [Cellvibrionaceae bacterium]